MRDTQRQEIEATEYRQRIRDTQRWRYTDTETETNRMYNTGTHKEMNTETHRVTGVQGHADTVPQYTVEITDTRAQRQWDIESLGH